MPAPTPVPDDEIRELCNVKYAAGKLDVTTQAIYRLLDAQAIESAYVGRFRKVYKDSLRDYIRSLPRTAPIADDEVA
jgi:hypothetical protein